MSLNIYISQPEIEEMLVQFYNATGIRVGIHDPDMEIVVEHPIKSDKIEELSFCDVMRKLSSTSVYKCSNCDRKALEHVQATKKSYIYRCHMGFEEALIPILSHGELMCVMMIGQIRAEGNSDLSFERCISHIKDLDYDSCSPEIQELLQTSFDQMKCMPSQQFNGFAYLLEVCAQSIYDKRWIRCEEKTIIENFVEYVAQNVYNDISIADAARALKVSRSHLSRIIQMNKNTTFTNYLMDQRMEVAKKLLLTTTMPVKDISNALKFKEPTYFMRVFKQKTGYTCTVFKKLFST